MRIRLLAFASTSTALGGGEHEIDLAPGATLADLEAQLTRSHPALAPLWPRLAIAVAGELARDRTAPLADGVEVALLPPVSGG